MKQSQGDERRRNRFVVEREFQFRYALKICSIGAIVLLIFGLSVLYLLKHNYDMLIESALLTMPSSVDGLQREFRMISLSFLGSLVLLVGVLFFFGILMTQRIAGPILSLKRRLYDFAQGESGVRLHLRQDDEFKNLELLFNTAMERYDERFAQLRKELQEFKPAPAKENGP